MQADQMSKNMQSNQNEIGQFESQDELFAYAMTQFEDGDLEIIRTSLTILNDMALAAEQIEDMQGELPTEITTTCVNMRKKMVKVIQAKSLFVQQQEVQGDPTGMAQDIMDSMTLYLDMMDEIDKILQQFKERYL